MDEEEIRGTRRDAKAERGERLGHAPEPISLCSTARAMLARSSSEATPAAMAGPETLNGPLMRFSASATASGQYAQPMRSEASP